MTSIPQRVGNYILEREIGRGGSSEVWLARHDHLEQRQVAIKVLTDQSREAVQRFNREANLASRLLHPNIVQLYDHGHSGTFYYSVFEYIHGGSLQHLLNRQKRLQLTDALAIFKQIASALDYAHSRNIIHRDVKPHNVLFEQATGRALLTDFGIARDTDRAITVVNSVMGTPGFWAPEQVQSATMVSHLSDIYSLGVVLYVMLSGDLPWEEPPGPSERVFGPPLPLKQRGVDNLPSDVDRVIQTMLAIDPAKRFPNAQAVVDELERIFVRHQMPTQVVVPVQADPATPGNDFQYQSGGVAQNAVETVLGPDLIRAPIAEAHQRAERLRQPVMIADLLNTWSQQAHFPPRQRLLGRLARLHKVTSHNIYFYQLQVLYERREAPQETEEPDHEAKIYPLEPELDRWQVTLPAVQDFKNDPGAQVVLPGSTRVVSCRSCSGKGATVCPRCKGKQRIYVTRTVEPAATPQRPNRGAVAASVGSSGAVSGAAPKADSKATVQLAPTATGAASTPRTEQVLVPCPECQGRGGIVCGRCEGVGRLIQRKAFHWKRVVKALESNDDLPGVDEERLSRLCKKVEVYRERASNGFRNEWGMVPILRDLVQQAQAATNDTTRIVLSEVVISFIPVTDVVFDLGKIDGKSGEGGLYKLAIYGFEDYIPADWRFLNWERVIYLCVLSFMTVLLVVFGVFVIIG